LFDADNDGDLDLYVVSGSVESPDTTPYQDRLYTNDGSGNFTLDVKALPHLRGSGSCVRAADFDGDGDLDLFVGGRVVPLKYPTPPESYILRNDNGVFTDVTNEMNPLLKSIGMVTDALWTDFNSDGNVDLVVVGEFMPISFFENSEGKLKRHNESGIDGVTGWWNSIVGGDFDKDGDTDYVVGNLGLNNSYQVKAEFPLKVFAKDFDGNGSIDPVMACYMRESMDGDVRKLYPVHFWDELNSQSPKFRNKFSKYKQYSRVTIDQIFTPEELNGSLILEANHMASSYIENLGDGKFFISDLPTLAQVAPINGMLAVDVNDDGNLDIIVVGNDYGNEVFAGRYDALMGLVLLGDGKGKFGVMPTTSSGFYVKGDAKALVNLFSATDQEIIVASQNRDSLMVFTRARSGDAEVMKIAPMESYADITFSDGKRQRVEFYYGAGYLSQPSRRLVIPPGTAEVIIYDYRGNSRKVVPGNL
jgi:hypothetical protein